MQDRSRQKKREKAVESLAEIADPLERLDALREFREQLEAMEQEAVSHARAWGSTWRDIGAIYGLSKQGAQQRFRRTVKPPDPAEPGDAQD